VVPYSTCVVAGWLVVHVTVAEVVVMPIAVTEVITGADGEDGTDGEAGADGVDAPVVEKVKFAEVASLPAEFCDQTR
jgi:hypothetical protein